MLALLDCCCGLDVHKDVIHACILKGSPDEEPVSIHAEFNAIQSDLQAMCIWLMENRCFNVAMESTGVYWRPVYEACEQFLEGYQRIIVVNAHHMRNLPGRKSDLKDSQWIATLFRHGLLEPSFIPNRLTRNLREYSRLRRSMVEERARYSNRLEKFLQAHGFKLSSVLSSILGASGRRLLTTLSEKGVLSPIDVYDAVDKRVKKPMDEIRSTVTGRLDYSERSYLKILLNKVDALDGEISDITTLMLHLAKPYKIQLEQLDSIPGIDIVAALTIISEISATPQDSFESSNKIVSWGGLSPRNDESAGKILSRKITKGSPYIKAILCQVAWAAVRTRKSGFHNWFWTHQGKLGRKKAIIAVARKILVLIYKLLKSGGFYDPMVAKSPIQSPC